ncbi:hypothetical protein BJ508DRAFT_418490 [Ascobolus immersus RN42]|uniref:Uncharacterized protein n=1 Tax=Ascobolus immersus RN42 TaxID=1160509 RepID=A0A3N4HN68_ASCIM|nr:hypothetical protein BJ508DRAFT_418490 [Ascobolus immersus RN42]
MRLKLHDGVLIYVFATLLAFLGFQSFANASAAPRNDKQLVLQAPSSLQQAFPQYDLSATNYSLIIPDWSSLYLFEGHEELKEVINQAIEQIKPVLNYVVEHPYVLIPLLIPAYPVWLAILGFGVEGIAAGSLAAIIHSKIGNIAKGSIFSFLQSHGARFGGWAFGKGGPWVTVAILIVIVGIVLVENFFPESKVALAMETGWNATVQNWTMPTVPGLPGRNDAVGMMGGEDVMVKAMVGSLGAGLLAALGMP